MTKYAYYDSAILENDQVIGWIDSEQEKNMPPKENLLEMTEEQWVSRSDSSYYVLNGKIVAYNNIFHVIQSFKKQELNEKCSKQITSGFVSTALGSKNLYASTEIDQLNIMIVYQSPNGGLLSYCDENGKWQKTMHTPVESKQVFEDLSNNINSCRLKLQNLLGDVEKAINVDDIKTISW